MRVSGRTMRIPTHRPPQTTVFSFSRLKVIYMNTTRIMATLAQILVSGIALHELDHLVVRVAVVRFAATNDAV